MIYRLFNSLATLMKMFSLLVIPSRPFIHKKPSVNIPMIQTVTDSYVVQSLGIVTNYASKC